MTRNNARPLSRAEQLWVKADAAWEKGELQSAFKLMRSAANLGDAGPQTVLGYFYDVGIGVKPSKNQALRWYRRAYRQGESAAANNIGTVFRDEGDFRRAVQWFERARSLGDKDANLEIGRVFLRCGNPRKAAAYFKEVVVAKPGEVTEASREQAERLLNEINSATPLWLRSELRISKPKPLPRSFYDRDPRLVAPDLLGKVLLRVRRGEKETILAGRIVETEAYLGADDAAAHVAAGKTARNAVLFGPPGHAYVYFIYGNHYCLNVSCLPDGDAGCVLIRALEPLAGLEQMARNRSIKSATDDRRPTTLRLLTSGPGRLCEALGITRPRDNGKDVTSRASDLWIGDDGFRPAEIATTARIGITKAAAHPLRYVIAGNEFVSGRVRIQNSKFKMQKDGPGST